MQQLPCGHLSRGHCQCLLNKVRSGLETGHSDGWALREEGHSPSGHTRSLSRTKGISGQYNKYAAIDCTCSPSDLNRPCMFSIQEVFHTLKAVGCGSTGAGAPKLGGWGEGVTVTWLSCDWPPMLFPELAGEGSPVCCSLCCSNISDYRGTHHLSARLI